MCKLCDIKPVYEFTNKRKLCKRCFVNYFQKKVLYTIRKFKMIKTGDVVKCRKNSDFKGVVLEHVLKFLSKKVGFDLVKSGKKTTKIAIDSSLDSEAENILKTLINGNVSELKEYLPVKGNKIKPLYLFLNEEILLYAKIKDLKFRKHQIKKSNVADFEDKFEKKHPEIKRAVVNSILELYK